MNPPPTPLSLEFERRPPPPREAVVAALREFFAGRPEVRLAYLFGSVAKDRTNALSDVDVAVLVDPEALARSAGYDFEPELISVLTRSLRFPKVDLAVLNGAPSLLRFLVARDGVLLKEREPGAAADFRFEAIRDYIDFEPARRIQRFYLRRSLGLLPEPEDPSLSPDRSRVEQRLEELSRPVQILRRHATVSPEELETDPERALAIEHALQLAIQCVLDVAGHLVSAQASVTPDTYEKVLTALGSTGIVPAEFARRIEKMAGLRNILVHMYLEVDFGRLTDALRRLDDFDEFARYALLALDRAG